MPTASVDVQLCADGVPVIIHDDTVDRTCDGTGRVADLTLAGVAAPDHRRQPWRAHAERTLRRARRRTLYNVELKASGIAAGGLRPWPAASNPPRRRRPHCWSRLSAPCRGRRVAGCRAPSPVAHAAERGGGRVCFPCVPAGGRSSCQIGRCVAHGDWARRRELRVNVWTVDDPAEARRLIGLGVDGIITNRPGALRRPA